VAGEKKSLDEIELIGQEHALQIVSWHVFGLSIITLNEEQASKLREDIDEWLSDKPKEKLAISKF
jgi:predicted house-cleaning noncanonical NTP pyrophosphatase (MazG superfamily)